MAPPAPGFKLNANGIPAFEDLPLQKTDPYYSAWGLYGAHDELGTLNRLTDSRVAAAAASEIQTGRRISLNWPLNAQAQNAFFARRVFEQQLIRKDPRVVNDDVWSFNTQVSTQWDGLRHYGYQREKRFYNGVTMEDIHGVGEDGRLKSTVNGIHAWAEQGIVGRGILIDYHSWLLSQPPSPSSPSTTPHDPFTKTPIPLSSLLACLASQGTVPRFGDILFLRTGFTSQLASKSPSEILAHQALSPPPFAGVEPSPELLRWLWSNFSAVAGDQPSFEAWPPDTQKAEGEGEGEGGRPIVLHEVLLAGWGCPIGELFDLERLAAHCREQKRWSFFVSSEPCNVPGGVASPPNVLAIF